MNLKTEIIYSKDGKNYSLKGRKADKFLLTLEKIEGSSTFYELPKTMESLQIKNKHFLTCSFIQFKNLSIIPSVRVTLDNCTFDSEEIEVEGKDLCLRDLHYLKTADVTLNFYQNLQLHLIPTDQDIYYSMHSEKAKEMILEGDGDHSFLSIYVESLESLVCQNLRHTQLELGYIFQKILIQDSEFSLERLSSCMQLFLKDSTLYCENLDFYKGNVCLEHSKIVGSQSMNFPMGTLKTTSHTSSIVLQDCEGKVYMNDSERNFLILRLLYLFKFYQRQIEGKIHMIEQRHAVAYDERVKELSLEIQKVSLEKKEMCQKLQKNLQNKSMKTVEKD